ncbi:hypothetical protein BDV96DRAFT_593300 [Lophiotrema nucula]|uniref:DUF7779 domain-containing protein n=1 Tax=Lophiotrema nucula TaxID=690887 RepID=A0A6A5ZVH2_9PLEO|nr:hypothetical protein BDV96DRAFT_593300 [Lophiotrema nucula]
MNEEPEVTRDKAKAWLANPVRTLGSTATDDDTLARWLIVFDNADELDYLYDFWPSGGNGCVLITSRDQIAKTTSLPNLSGIELPPMPTEDAAQSLQKTSLREDEAEGLETCNSIAERLGGLPLALVQMAHLIRIRHLSLAEFVEYYDYDSKKFQEASIPGYTKQQTVAFVWNIESLDPAARALLHVLSFLVGDSVPEEILINDAKKVDLKDYPSTNPADFEAREALMKSSLITRNSQPGILRMHRLVQDVKYQPQVSKLRDILVAKGVEEVEASLLIAALFNESAWTYLLACTGYGFKLGDEFAVLSQQVVTASNEDKEEAQSKILADSYRYQVKKWIEVLVERIQKYQKKEDINTLSIAYNEYGRALMWVPDKAEAMRSWQISLDSVLQPKQKGDLPFPFPWMHTALVIAFDGKLDDADSTILPILEERTKKLGKDDTKTHE